MVSDKILELIEKRYSEALDEYLIHSQVLELPIRYDLFVAWLEPSLNPVELSQIQPRSLTYRADQKGAAKAMDVAFSQLTKNRSTAIENSKATHR
jgi:hypothetical protein